MTKGIKKSSVKVGRSAASGRFTNVKVKPSSAQTMDKIATRHKRVLKRLADK